MKKKIISFVLSMVAILSVCTVFATAGYMGFDSKYGNMHDFEVTFPTVIGTNTKLSRGQKSYVERNHCEARIISGTIKEMNCWIEDDSGNWVSKKEKFYPDGNARKLYYTTNAPFKLGECAVLWGEQYTGAKKTAKGEFYCH